MDITTVIFDIGGVLVWTQWERVTGPLAELTGLTPERVMEELVRGNAYHPFMRGEFDQYEFHRRIVDHFGLELEAENWFRLWSDIIAPHEEIVPLIEQLKGRYRLALASSTDVIHYAAGLEVQPVFEHFDGGILSFEVGYLKPDLEFFRVGLQRMSLTPEECVFTDDRLENVEAARSVGITAFQFESVEKLEDDLQSLGVL